MLIAEKNRTAAHPEVIRQSNAGATPPKGFPPKLVAS